MAVVNEDRYRCTMAGCNPVMYGEGSAVKHNAATGHRTAKWPVRSASGKRKAAMRNSTGYYDKYNVGYKSAANRGIVRDDGEHPFSSEALGQE